MFILNVFEKYSLLAFHLFSLQYFFLSTKANKMFLWSDSGDSKSSVKVMEKVWAWISSEKINHDFKHKTGQVDLLVI